MYPPLSAAPAPSTPNAVDPVLALTPTAASQVQPQAEGRARSLSRRPGSGQRASQDLLAEELRFLSSVDADIRAGAYDRALQRLAHNKTASPLQEERSAMRVLALCGRAPDAKAARARDELLTHSPSSVLAARVRAACAAAQP